MAPGDSASEAPLVVQWVLDTRRLWPEAVKTSELPRFAHDALALLPEQERIATLKYHFVSDAKMSLGSRLMKRYVISRYCGVPWSEATVTTRDYRKKPVFVLPDGSEPLILNVSHQAGLVVLIAIHHPPPGVNVGVDVVCPHERRDRDLESIREQGWPHFVDIHADVFGIDEVSQLKKLRGGTDDGQDEVTRRLHYFYALWCLREAYVKMTGDALLADWLRELELKQFAPPQDGQTHSQEAWLRGKKVEDVDLRLMDLLDGYMVSTSVSYGPDGPVVRPEEFSQLELGDILKFATGS